MFHDDETNLINVLDVTKNVLRVFMEEAVNTNVDAKTERGKPMD